jgi:hypothetical protein
MDSSDIGTFSETTTVDNLSSSHRLEGNAYEFLSRYQQWHQPESSLAGHSEPSMLEDQWVFVDTSDHKTWVVYLITNKEWL